MTDDPRAGCPAHLDPAALLSDGDAEFRRAAEQYWWAHGIDLQARPMPAVLDWDANRDALTDRRLSPRSFSVNMVENGLQPETSRQVAPLFSLHGDEHLRQRRILSKAFSAKRVEELRPTTTAICERLADDIAGAGETCEFVETFATPLPPEVFATLFGLPVQDSGRLAEWATAISYAFSLSMTPAEAAEVERAAAEMREYGHERIAVARAEPGQDLVTRLLEADDEGHRLDDDQVIGMITGFVFAGAETTRRQLTAAVQVLAEHADEWDRLAEDPDRMPNAVEEVLRHSSIIPGLTRLAEEPYERGDLRVERDERLLLAFPTANNDPHHFEVPERFDPSRENASSHVTFGWGPHHCVGAGLARMEMVEALGVLTRRFEAPVVIEVGEPSTLVAPSTLIVRLSPRAH